MGRPSYHKTHKALAHTAEAYAKIVEVQLKLEDSTREP